MSKALKEYITFLKENEERLPEIEKKLSNIILENFTAIEDSSSASGSRGRLIGRLIENHGDSVSGSLSFEDGNDTEIENNIKLLSELSVKNFRGFTEEVKFQFNKPFIFVYGPNGTGKSSFCEALEYSLLGTIHEANAKRISIDTYIKNVYTGGADRPVLKGINHRGEQFEIEPMPQINEFSFIERNRIEGFARVSANTPQAQQERLASLFGLDDFNKFVTNFNESIENYINCNGKLAEELSVKEKQIEIHKVNLEKIPQQKEEVSKEIALLLGQYSEVDTLDELKLKINGGVETDGLIQKNNSTIAKLENLKPITNSGIDQVIEELEHLKVFNDERNQALSLIDKYKDEVSLKDLYSAIISNEGKFQDKCPACESQIYADGKLALPLNPFTNAAKKIEEFDRAIKLEERVNVLTKDILRKLQFTQNKLTYIVTISKSIDFPGTETINALCNLYGDLDGNEKQHDIISTLVHQKDIFNTFKEFLSEYNQRVSTTQTKIEELKQQNIELSQKLEKLSSLQLRVKTLDDIEKEANEAIKQFRSENEDLITKVQQEEAVVARNNLYRDAYVSLRNRLVEYNRQLPVLLATNLNSKTLEFYNLINRYDHPSDLLSEIILPDRPRKKIEIRFSVGEKQDALHVLSEGHLRCLGLAILLAKNVQDELPLVIFDDVVNAIDDEHRRGIIDTIINSDFSNHKQLIITTHGEEFLKQLENSLPTRDYNRLVTRIDFLKTEESKKINVKLDTSRKYLIVAEQRFNDGQIRESLAPGRRALEFLVRTIWKRISRKYNIRLSISMSSPDRPPELMATTQALVKYVKDNNIVEYEQLINLLEAVLEKPVRNQVIWNYLNKGTHDEERDEEFDRSIVKEIIELLVQIDDLVFTR